MFWLVFSRKLNAWELLFSLLCSQESGIMPAIWFYRLQSSTPLHLFEIWRVELRLGLEGFEHIYMSQRGFFFVCCRYWWMKSRVLFQVILLSAIFYTQIITGAWGYLDLAALQFENVKRYVSSLAEINVMLVNVILMHRKIRKINWVGSVLFQQACQCVFSQANIGLFISVVCSPPQHWIQSSLTAIWCTSVCENTEVKKFRCLAQFLQCSYLTISEKHQLSHHNLQMKWS